MMHLIYLASPYSHSDGAVRRKRFQAACRVTARLIREGHNVFSPIVHSHPLTAHGMGGDWTTWQAIDHDWIRRCDEVVVLTLDGWMESVGVTGEIDFARSIGRTVRYIGVTQ